MSFTLHPFSSRLLKNPPEWLFHPGVVKSSRSILSRNLANYNFVARLAPLDMHTIWEEIRTAIRQFWGDSAEYIYLEDVTEIERGLMCESELLPEEAFNEPEGKGLIISKDNQAAVLVNFEDHIRILAMLPGYQLKDVFEGSNVLDDRLCERLEFAYDSRLGFLTSSPSHLGSALTLSCNVHLPALTILKQMNRIFNGASTLGMSVNNIWGRNQPAKGNLLQVANQTTLGLSESEIVQKVQETIQTLEYHEKRARLALTNDAYLQILDKVERAEGILSHARLMSTREALPLLAALRLGAELAFFDVPDLTTIDILTLRIQPARMQLEYGDVLTHEDREAYRAELIRNTLNN